MISLGIVLVLGAVSMAAVGIMGYLASHRSKGKSRSAAVGLFGYGALSTGGILSLAALVHVHSLTAVHFHDVYEGLAAAFDCDLELSCVAWIAASVAGTILGSSFLLSQLVSRGLVARALRKGARVVRLDEPGDVRLLVVEDSAPDAYSLALLKWGGPAGFHARSYVIVTTGLMNLLAPEERRAVIEHEVAHVRARDDRYMPFFHTIASVIFFDPFLRQLRESMGRRYEFEADDGAARRTRNPRALARALLKLSEIAPSFRGAPALFGRVRPSDLIERIERLLLLAELMESGRA